MNYKLELKIRYWFLFSALMLMSCAGTKEVVKEDTPLTVKYQYDESFDPLTLDDDDIVIAGDDDPQIIENSVDKPINENPLVIKEKTGFRVQILATKNIETASLFEQEASERFNNLDHKTYLIFEAPLYKIRVGDCEDRAQAEELRDQAMQYGYRESFIVKSKIQVHE